MNKTEDNDNRTYGGVDKLNKTEERDGVTTFGGIDTQERCGTHGQLHYEGTRHFPNLVKNYRILCTHFHLLIPRYIESLPGHHSVSSYSPPPTIPEGSSPPGRRPGQRNGRVPHRLEGYPRRGVDVDVQLVLQAPVPAATAGAVARHL